MLQKSYAEALRALVIYTATWQDKVAIAQAAGDTEAAKAASKVNDLLLPLVKGVGSERAYELLGHESLQTFGGSGFLQDYPLEQYVRDAKIDTLYEGTTAIQSLDLIFRKIVKDQGQALADARHRDAGFIESEAGNGQLKVERLALGKALGELQQILGVDDGLAAAAVQGGDTRELYKVGLTLAPDPARARRRASSPGCCCARPRWRSRRSAATSRPPTRTSTRARSRRPGSSPARCCPGSAPTAGSSRTPHSTSWTCPRTRSELAARRKREAGGQGRPPASPSGGVVSRGRCAARPGASSRARSCDHGLSGRCTARPLVFRPTGPPSTWSSGMSSRDTSDMVGLWPTTRTVLTVLGHRPQQVEDLGAAAGVQALARSAPPARRRPGRAWASAIDTPCQVCRVRAAGEQKHQVRVQPLVGQPGSGRVRVGLARPWSAGVRSRAARRASPPWRAAAVRGSVRSWRQLA